MTNPTRRRILKSAALLVGSPSIFAAPPATDIQVIEVDPSFEDYHYRTPIKFGGSVVDRVTLLNVKCTVRGRRGGTAHGFGSMPLGNVWSFPSKRLTYDQTLAAMKALAARISRITATEREWGHPIDINQALESRYLSAAGEVSRGMAEPIPVLCTMVTASPFDAAIHDAYGKLHNRNSFDTLGPEFLHHDLGYYLGPDFKGETLDRYILPSATPELPLYHLVGAVDPIAIEDIQRPVGDGLPETLPEWIRYNGLTHLKIKLNGDDRGWDLKRVIRVHDATAQIQRTGVPYVYSLDFNEKCPNVGYLIDFLTTLRSRSPGAFSQIQYVEQPTARDLDTHPRNEMHAASRLVPVVIDESLTGKDAFLKALEMGYSGAALKACKGQSQSLLMAALGQKRKVFLCVQDLTCPGASLVHSVALAAHVPAVRAIEANARQYVPAANRGWEKRFPGIFIVKSGTLNTTGIDGPGLGAVPPLERTNS